MLNRKTPLRRSGPIKRRSRVSPISSARSAERKEYAKRRAAYLAAHPWDQIKIAFCGFDEDEVKAHAAGLDRSNAFGVYFQGQLIPVSTQIHHRAKCRGPMLNDERWWMATASKSHEMVEQNKSWAREHGFLLPIQADKDGRWGSGLSALPTPEFMKARAGK